jgi:hypothetical protein
MSRRSVKLFRNRLKRAAKGHDGDAIAALYGVMNMRLFLLSAMALTVLQGAFAPGAEARQHAFASGAYCGRYTYESTGAQSVPFNLNVRRRGAEISGVTREPNTFGDPDAKTLGASIVGRVERDVVRFRKTYDGSGGVAHSVDYVGRLKGGAVRGEWNIGGVTGPFEMRRCPSALTS